ncbi:hypothetical protein [Sanguibacter sp. 25GB23B1]|uniref:hypothetical protein n=1 Tax=unclassified Sanguibacter TaxID=2645534 RepID=UPI0032AEA0FF
MTLQANLEELALRSATEAKALRTLVNGNLTDLSGLTTTAKGNLVAALNEARALALSGGGGGDSIDDANVSTETTYSSSKIVSSIDMAITALVAGAPGSLDTLKEFADALAADQAIVNGVLSAIALRVRVDAAQAFDTTQQAQGRSNIGAASAAAVGDTEVDLVAIYQAALA